jgi:hypothetical protein
VTSVPNRIVTTTAAATTIKSTPAKFPSTKHPNATALPKLAATISSTICKI